MAWSPFDPFRNVAGNLADGYQFGDFLGGMFGIKKNDAANTAIDMTLQKNGISMPLSDASKLVTGETDYERNMAMSAAEHQMSRDDMALQNAFTAEREDLAYARNKADALDNRAWETMMANTSIQRQVADMKAAGLNPWAMSGGAGAAVPSTQLAGANSASSANVSPLRLPESRIWANTSDSIKSALSNIMSIFMISKLMGI